MPHLEAHGQSLERGGRLCVLTDYSQLYIEGSAFGQDITANNKATAETWKIAALFRDTTYSGKIPVGDYAGHDHAK